ncbi:hypothetical protein LCGC14_2112540, partial [marine sediment metagenome]
MKHKSIIQLEQEIEDKKGCGKQLLEKQEGCRKYFKHPDRICGDEYNWKNPIKEFKMEVWLCPKCKTQVLTTTNKSKISNPKGCGKVIELGVLKGKTQNDNLYCGKDGLCPKCKKKFETQEKNYNETAHDVLEGELNKLLKKDLEQLEKPQKGCGVDILVENNHKRKCGEKFW